MNIFKTNELSEKHLNQIRYLFFDSFGQLPSINDICLKYSSTYLGYSFHYLYFDKDQNLIGSFVFMPKIFKFHKKEIVGLLLHDTSFPYEGKVNPYGIKKGVFQLLDFCNKIFEQECFLYGFPNDKIEKLWNFLLKWKYIDSIKPVIDICPLLTILSQENKFFSNKKQIKMKFNSLDKNPRFFSFGETSLGNESNPLNMWFLKKIFPVQVIDNLNIASKPKLITKKSLFMIWRLFLPSILGTLSSTKNRKWQYKFFSKTFPMYVLDQNNLFNFQECTFHPSFLWNDVP
tara:strand:- start:132 stop:995 length:864 start_codon:yes stop_codon:yes gene_type:complete